MGRLLHKISQFERIMCVYVCVRVCVWGGGGEWGVNCACVWACIHGLGGWCVCHYVSLCVHTHMTSCQKVRKRGVGFLTVNKIIFKHFVFLLLCVCVHNWSISQWKQYELQIWSSWRNITF